MLPANCWRPSWKQWDHVRRPLPCREDLYSYRIHGYEEVAERSGWYHPVQLPAGPLQQFFIHLLRETCWRIKAVHYEGNGFCLFYKRYENGRLQWPRTGEEARQTSPSSYAGCWRAWTRSSQKLSANGLPPRSPEIPYKCWKILLFYGIINPSEKEGFQPMPDTGHEYKKQIVTVQPPMSLS